MKKAYLAGQPDLYEPWRSKFDKLEGFEFYNPDLDSDQSSPDTFFPQDLQAVSSADYLVAYPATAPSEGTWIEIGYFLAKKTLTPGDKCNNLIIIWTEERQPKWSIEFVKKAGNVVSNVEEAIELLSKL